MEFKKGLVSFFLSLIVLNGLGAAEFEVQPDIGPWKNNACPLLTSAAQSERMCEAAGGNWLGMNTGGCVGDDPDWDQSPIEQYLQDYAEAASSTYAGFSGWGVTPNCPGWSTGPFYTLGKYSGDSGIGYMTAGGLQASVSVARARTVTCPLGSVQQDKGQGDRCYVTCAEGEVLVGGQCAPPPNKNDGNDCENGRAGNENSTANPCNVATGAKYRTEVDIDNGELPFIRYYNSNFLADIGLGAGWRTNYHRYLYIDTNTLTYVSATGRGEQWTRNGNAWQGDNDSKLLITETANGFQVEHNNGWIEQYNLDGNITSRTSPKGETTSYSYNANKQLQSVTNEYGHELSFTYIGTSLSSVTDANGASYQYEVSSDNNLVSVTYPDETLASTDNPVKTYIYDHPTLKNHLTGIIDEKGDRYATFNYDASGRAVLSELAITINTLGQEAIGLAYGNGTNGGNVVTHADGTQEEWVFEDRLGAKKLTQKNNLSDGKGFNQTWDANGNKTSRTDAEGMVTTYQYNSFNQRISMTEAYGTTEARTTTYEYVSNDIDVVNKEVAPSVLTGNAKTTNFNYDADLNLASVVIQGFTEQGSPISRSTVFTYDSLGKLLTIDGPRTDVSDITTLRYYNCSSGERCGKLFQVENALGHITSYDDYDNAGRLLQTTSPNGLVTKYTYTARGWLSSIERIPLVGDPRLISFSYDGLGQLDVVTFPDGSSLDFDYDASHALRSIKDNLGNQVEYDYDARGNQNHERIKDPNGNLERQIQRVFDTRDFVDEINAGGSITDVVTNAVGDTVEETDPKLNPTTLYQYDGLHRLDKIIDSLANTTDIDYNVADQITQITAPNLAVTAYEYDDLGNLLKETSPDRGTTSYQYDVAGNLRFMTDARGIVTEYQYDVLNRLTHIIYPNPTENVTLVYDTGGDCGTGIGKLCSVVDATGTQTYEYDIWGNVIKQSWLVGATTHSVSYGYDEMDRLSRVVYPSGMTVDYQRDAVGRVEGVFTPTEYGDEVLADKLMYRADGLLKSYRFGSAQVVERNHDLKGQLTSIYVESSLLVDYSYDDNGNVTTSNWSNQSRDYGYDVLDRLERDDVISGWLGHDWEYDYDANGNRILQIKDNNSLAISHVPNSNQIDEIDNTPVTRDAAGNITAMHTNAVPLALTYNNNGHLASATQNGQTANYTYNYLRLRGIKQLNGNTSHYLYDLTGRLIATVDAQGVAHEDFVYANEFDTTPIHYRLYDDTEANTVEAQQALAKSELSVKVPVDSNGQCDAFERTHAERVQSNAITLPNGFDGIDVGGDRVLPLNKGWLVAIITEYLLFEEEQIIPDEVDLDGNSDFIDESEVIVTWPDTAPPPPQSTDVKYVVEVGTTKRALNNGPDVARHCILPGQNNVKINHIPLNGTKVYVRLWKKEAGIWVYEDFEFDTPESYSANLQVSRNYLLQDHLGTPRVAYDDEQITTWEWMSDGFGQDAPEDDPSATGYQTNLNIRFPGQYYDVESRLNYNWNRYYDAETGRYVTSDPIGLDGGLNTFGYVYGNPLTLIDPMGLKSCSCSIQCGSLPGLLVMSCWKTKICVDDCNNVTTERIYLGVMTRDMNDFAFFRDDEVLCKSPDMEGWL